MTDRPSDSRPIRDDRKLTPREILDRLNEAHARGPDEAEREFLDAAARIFAKLTEGQW